MPPVGYRISPELDVFSDPVSLGGLCQAMFIEGARMLGYAEEALVPTEVLKQIFWAATVLADGLDRLLQNQGESSRS